VALANTAIEIGQRLCDGEHKRQSLFGDRQGVGANRDHHRDLVSAGALDVDRLNAHTMFDYDLHASGFFVHGATDAPARTNDYSIGVLLRGLRRNLLLGAVGLHQRDASVALLGDGLGALGQGWAGDKNGSGHGASARESGSGKLWMRPAKPARCRRSRRFCDLLVRRPLSPVRDAWCAAACRWPSTS